MDNEILYKEESYKIMGACFEVYKAMGPGFLEAVYQECLAKEFNIQKIPFKQLYSLKLNYKGTALDQTYQVDFLCYEKIILEIKSAKKIAEEHRAQTINYLRATSIQLGLLINFSHHPKIEYERFVNQHEFFAKFRVFRSFKSNPQ